MSAGGLHICPQAGYIVITLYHLTNSPSLGLRRSSSISLLDKLFVETPFSPRSFAWLESALPSRIIQAQKILLAYLPFTGHMESSRQTDAAPTPESTTKDILVVGVTHPSANAPEEVKQGAGSDPVLLRQKIGAVVETARKAGYKLEVRRIAPEELGAKVGEIKQLLQRQSWDATLLDLAFGATQV
ncbi:hypothetical protein MMC13_003727 [Lambiella insularis]|nr:hypothetical protein [Lambiella insularis]